MSLHAPSLTAALALLASAFPLVAVAADKHPAGIVVDHAWFATVPNGGPTYGYFRITNNSGKPRMLTGFSAPPCSSLQLEEAHGGGLNAKEAVKMTVAPQTRLAFSRGGYHLVCLRKGAAPSPGQTVPVTITLDDGSTIPMTFAVRSFPH